MSQTLFDRIWALHEVSDGLLYIDLHLVHEVTSPQAFDGLRLEGRPVRRPDRTLATADHNVPTDGTPVAARIRDELSRVQVETLERNCEEFGIPLYSMGVVAEAKLYSQLGRTREVRDENGRGLRHGSPPPQQVTCGPSNLRQSRAQCALD